jgi:hypothetical protein
MLRDLLTQIPRTFKRLLILDSPEHVDSENIKLILGHGPLLYQLCGIFRFFEKSYIWNLIVLKLSAVCSTTSKT